MRLGTWWLVGLAVGVIACGGRQDTSKPVNHDDDVDTDDDDGGGDQGAFVSPEKLDEIQAVFTRRRPQASRCYKEAEEAGAITKDQAGRVTVELDVTAQGGAKNVHITETTLKVKSVEDCLVKLVGSWNFPPPGAQVKFSFSYTFEHDW